MPLMIKGFSPCPAVYTPPLAFIITHRLSLSSSLTLPKHAEMEPGLGLKWSILLYKHCVNENYSHTQSLKITTQYSPYSLSSSPFPPNFYPFIPISFSSTMYSLLPLVHPDHLLSILYYFLPLNPCPLLFFPYSLSPGYYESHR